MKNPKKSLNTLYLDSPPSQSTEIMCLFLEFGLSIISQIYVKLTWKVGLLSIHDSDTFHLSCQFYNKRIVMLIRHKAFGPAIYFMYHA